MNLPKALGFVTLTLLCLQPVWAAPKVVVSIAPIHSLVAALMEDVGEPVLLIDGTTSPHGAALRPSQVGEIHNAQLIIWIGESFETSLARQLPQLENRVPIVRIMSLPGMHLLRARRGGVFNDEYIEEQFDADVQEINSDELDPHVWLNTGNAKSVVFAVYEALVGVDPGNQALYDRNYLKLDGDLSALENQLRGILAPVRDKPFIVLHDAFQYLEQQFNLNSVGSLYTDPHQPASVKRVTELREAMRQLAVECVFTEPQLPDRLARTLADGLDARLGILDALNSTNPSTAGSYRTMMLHNADSLARCLL